MSEKEKDLIEQIALFLQECRERDKFDYLETAEALIDFLDIDAESFDFSDLLEEVSDEWGKSFIALNDDEQV
jgi:elongation factor P--beta-lysine ligase